LSNSSTKGIKEFKREFGDRFFAHEGHLSFEVRALQDKKVFDVCQELGVKNIIWQPLRRNRTTRNNWSLLKELSKKYQKTQNQIILNWIVSLGYLPMVMSTNKKHIDENVAATEFRMDAGDYQRINLFRPPNYSPPLIDWEKTGEGVSIIIIVNDFEGCLV